MHQPADFTLEQLASDAIISITGTQGGRTYEVTLSACPRSTHSVWELAPSNGDMGLVATNLYTDVATTLTKRYFYRNQEHGNEFKVSATLRIGYCFFDGREWFTARDFAVA